MVDSFNRFAEVSDEIGEFEKKIQPDIRIGEIGITRSELHRRRSNQVRKFIDLTRKRGFDVLPD